MEVAKKEGKSNEEKLADGKRKKQRIREEMPQNGYLAFTAVRIPQSSNRNSYRQCMNR